MAQVPSRPISLWKKARILEKQQVQGGEGQIQAASLGFLWELVGTKHSCFVPLVWTDGMKTGNKPATIGLRGAFCNSEVRFLQDACKCSFFPWPHEGSVRDGHPETQKQCEMGREMGIVRQPRGYHCLSRGRELAGAWSPRSKSWGNHRITSLLGFYDALYTNLSRFCCLQGNLDLE